MLKLLTLATILMITPLFSEKADDEIAFEDENCAVADDEIAFEDENCEVYDKPCHRHSFNRYNGEEERLYEERTETSWPSKRGDPMIERLTH